MAVRLFALSVGAHEPEGLAQFWAGVLGREPGLDAEGNHTLHPAGDADFPIRFTRSDEPKRGPNQMHFDLTSTSLDDQRQTVERALALGARHLDIGQRPEEGHVVLADPEDNEFCVVGPDNTFLLDTARIGALSCDGTREVGHFWSAALGWPLVWDQDEETAVQAPDGGSKISWGGPPLNPRLGKNRFHLDLATPAGDLQTEVDRVLGLGATRRADGEGDRVVLADPDGNEFCLLARRW